MFSFTVDAEHNKKHNELYRDSSRIGTAAFIFAAVLFVFAFIITRVYQGQVGYLMAAGLAIMGIISIFMGFTLPKKMGTPQELFDQFPLCPAIIAEVNGKDITLLALVNRSVNPEATPIWALTTRVVFGLPGHEIRVGERVPSVAVGGRRGLTSQELRAEITPMPITWGTPDKKVIDEAAQQIPTNQWRRLASQRSRLAEVKASRDNLVTL